MVALAVRYLGQTPVICHARPMLLSAQDSLDRGDLIAAGCKLREAVRRFTHALCEYYDCWPAKKHERRSGACMADALRKARHIDKEWFKWLIEAVEIGNKLAHLQEARESLVRWALLIVYDMLDQSTELVHAGKGGVDG